MSVNGHDEKYIGWGYEDKDLVFRASRCGYNMRWIDDQTSMIHLPHERNDVYFSSAIRLKNEKRYKQKRDGVIKTVRANLNGEWGQV